MTLLFVSYSFLTVLKTCYRHAALMAISAVGEGCQKHMEDMLPFIVDAVLHFINDPVSYNLNVMKHPCNCKDMK